MNFNQEPYVDDFDVNKKFYKILFRPSYAVQTRELNQLQSILQQQITAHGDSIFKQGSMVVPGQISVETSTNLTGGIDYIKLNATYNNTVVETFIDQLQDKIITGTSGIKAKVVHIEHAINSDSTTLYIRYISSSTSGTVGTFSVNEVITDQDNLYSFTPSEAGKGSICSIEQGVYYVNGYFVLVEAQTIPLDKYSANPTYRVGLNILEKVITAEEDESLLDQAQGTPNFSAPGADRYYIELVLEKRDIDSNDDTSFIELVRVSDGKIKTINDKPQYSIIAQELARRTYDESGDYTVNGLNLDIREHRNNNRGTWTSNTSYRRSDVVTYNNNTYVAENTSISVSTPPTHTSGSSYDGSGSTGVKWTYTISPYYNRGIYVSGDESKLAIGIEAGKAYVKGYEIEKHSITYLDIPKARDFEQLENIKVDTSLGNYIIVEGVNNLPPIENFGVVSLCDTLSSNGTYIGNVLGTARVSFMEFHDGLPLSSSSKYKLGLFDIKLNNDVDFNRSVKSITFNRSDSNLNFTANISPINVLLSGTISSSGINVTGVGTSFQTQLRVGDYIHTDSSYRKVVSISSQSQLTVDSTLTASGLSISLVTTNIVDTDKNTLVYRLPNFAVKSVRDGNNINDTSYTVYQKFTQTATGTTLTLSASGNFTSAFNSTNYIVFDNDTSSGGSVITPISIVPSGTTCTITLPSDNSGHSISVIAGIEKVIGVEKTKTLTQASPLTLTTKETATAVNIVLNHPDVFKINQILMDTGTFTAPTGSYTIDITDRYDLNNGQNSMFYDLSSLSLKSSFTAPSAPIRVLYQYFLHSAGDYFTVNSYSSINYDEIPSTLRDCFDYRPSVATKADAYPSSFTPASASLSLIPKRGVTVETDYSYYLPRRDKIALDYNGVLLSKQGVSSLSLNSPEDPSLSMVMYDMVFSPYTFNTSSNNVLATKIENKRYTMRDIGKLEKRIDNLEYYTALSLLEQETQALVIKDEFGLDRFKNGFVVDNFKGGNLANSSSADYKCAIDMEKGELRPFYTVDNVRLLEKNTTDAQRTSSGYQINGDIVTLPILTNKVLVEQKYASRTENVNPFAVFTFLGNMDINPSSDDWFETEKAPDIIQQVEGNYNVIKNLAENQGILGTVWGAWNTEWVGTSSVVSSSTSRLPPRTISVWTTDQGADNTELVTFGLAGINDRTTTVLSTQIGQSRQGITTSLQSKTDYEVIDERTINSTIIPYIRSRNILIQINGLKPSTKFYPFFDNIDISSYCTPSKTIGYSNKVGNFNITSNVGNASEISSRLINGDAQVCLNKGDILTGSISGATAILVGFNNESSTLSVVNQVGTFTNGELLTGSISGATATFNSISTPTDIKTNSAGQVNFLFNIPNSEAVRFRTGKRELKLIDVASSSGVFSSRAIGTYTASGVLETKQSTVNAVRNAELVREQVSQSNTIFQLSEQVTETGWYDPLAQSFAIDSKGGAFLTELDLYFASKDTSVPVTIEIREMVNGSPGKNVLPFSRRTFYPSQVNISNNIVNVNGTDYPAFDTPTTFKFITPVYVQDKTEYCFVVLSDSNNYRVWISNVGDTIPGTNSIISEQPYNGVLFKSQNASTWTADQLQDMKFTLRQAQFDTNSVGNLALVNGLLSYDTLEREPFQTISGSSVIRVWHNNHGMFNGSSVNIKGVTANFNGITPSMINNTFVISNVDKDCYTITLSGNATITGYGGLGAMATRNIPFDIITPTLQTQTFTDTDIGYQITYTSGKSLDGSETPYLQSGNVIKCINKENLYLDETAVVASGINETTYIGGNKAFTLNAILKSNNTNISPAVDTSRISCIMVSNKVNNPTVNNVNVASLDTKVAFTGSTGSFTYTTGGTITSTNSSVISAMQTLGIGRYIEITGTTSNNKTVLVTDFTFDGTTATIYTDSTFVAGSSSSGHTISVKELFVDEIAILGSSSTSKYVTSPIKFVTPASFIKMKFSADIPIGAVVRVFYSSGIGNINNKYIEIKQPLINNTNGTLVDRSIELADLEPFDTIVFKIVLNSTNSTSIPRIKDLRIICCA